MKKNNLKHYNKALELGLFKVNYNDLNVYKLSKYLSHKNCQLSKLTKSIAYSMTNSVNYRNTSKWKILKNYGNFDLEYIAILDYTCPITSIDELVLIDFSIIKTKRKQQFLDKHKIFKEELLDNLYYIYNLNGKHR